MYKDVQNSNNVDKQMLNQLVNENVIPFTKKNRKVNFHKVSNKKIKDDKNLLKCSMFKK